MNMVLRPGEATIIDLGIMLPYAIPGTVVAIALIATFNAPHWFTANNILVGTAVILPLAYFIRHLPIQFRATAAAFAQFDPALDEAARNLGASTWNVFRTITVPLARPGLAAAILTTAIYVLEDFGNPLLIAGQFTVLPSQAYSLIEGFGDFAGAAAVSTILLVLALVLYVAKLRIEGNRSYVTISGKATSIPRPPVPRAAGRGARGHRTRPRQGRGGLA